MAWYKVKTSDGAEHRLWFGHDPSEADVLEHLKAPTVSEGRESLPEQDDQPEVGVGGSPLQRMMGTEADPNSPEVMAKALILGASAPGGPLAGAAVKAGGGLLGAASRVATSAPSVGGATGAALGALESGGDLKHTLIGGAGGAAAAAGLPLVGHGLTKIAGKVISSSLSARLAHTLTREAPEAVAASAKILKFGPTSSSLPGEIAATVPRAAQGATAAAKALEGAGLSPELATAEAAKAAQATGEVSGSLPGVFTPPKGTPKLPMPAVSLSEDIQAQVAKLRASGLSRAQITAAVRETHGLEADTAKKVVEMISEAQGGRIAATTEALPAGRKLAPPYRGGKAQAYQGPARVPQNDQDLMSLLRQSVENYKIP